MGFYEGTLKAIIVTWASHFTLEYFFSIFSSIIHQTKLSFFAYNAFVQVSVAVFN